LSGATKRFAGRGVLIAGAALALAACAPLPQRPDIPTRWQPSPNFNARQADLVVIHHTGSDTAERALRVLADPVLKVSAHYLVARDGVIYQLVDERARAWHAGKARWGAVSDVNSASLGVELDNSGDEPFPPAQIAALMELLADIKRRHGIPTANFVGHSDVSPRRKVDPSRHFPWRELAMRGFGLWCDAPQALPPPGFDPTLALHALGYDVSDLEAAIGAFKLHYVQDDSPPLLTDAELGLLNCLVRRKAAAG
jgi:N-acetylmuramoyl-L-alanine amidase